ncbi:Hypothetical protein (Fragment) [Durusdinium trenchii]|uniref:Uncharacterized protein n=1 Tax=Durusdinium trenchii TaxID=1381693 RepID=A0ABP0LU89_9DINO
MAQAFRKRTRVVEALPPYDLAKSKLVNFDLFGELRRAHADEARRHYACLTTPNVGLVERKCPYGAPLPKKTSKTKLMSKSLPQLPSLEPSAEVPKPKRIPGLQLLEIPYDPTTFPSEHAERINLLESQIAEKELSLENPPLRKVNGPSFDFDHLPQGQSSEARMQYFPRSTTIIRDIGCGKDPRFCRPWGPYEQHREAGW